MVFCDILNAIYLSLILFVKYLYVYFYLISAKLL